MRCGWPGRSSAFLELTVVVLDRKLQLMLLHTCAHHTHTPIHFLNEWLHGWEWQIKIMIDHFGCRACIAPSLTTYFECNMHGEESNPAPLLSNTIKKQLIPPPPKWCMSHLQIHALQVPHWKTAKTKKKTKPPLHSCILAPPRRKSTSRSFDNFFFLCFCFVLFCVWFLL